MNSSTHSSILIRSISIVSSRQHHRLLTTACAYLRLAPLVHPSICPSHYEKNWSAWTRRTLMRQAESKEKQRQREALVQEATKLTCSLYRRCLRSIEVIRWGNEFDEMDFKKREEEFSNPTPGSRLSMAPPPNRDDELESRAEYYRSFARENFMNESDCLTNIPLKERDIKRFLYYLKKGERDRKWLLGDMLFPDPCQDEIGPERIKSFEIQAEAYLGQELEPKSEVAKKPLDDFWDDDEAESEDPDFFRKKFPHLR